MRRSVDLPQPEGPSNATNSPSRIVKLMPRSASTCLLPRPKFLPTFFRLTSSVPSVLNPFSAMCLLHSVFFFSQPIQTTPEIAIQADHDEDHVQCGGSQQGKVAGCRRLTDDRPKARHAIGFRIKNCVLRDDAGIPGTAARRHQPRTQIRNKA